MIKYIKKYFDGFWRPLKAFKRQKKEFENDDATTFDKFSYSYYDFEFPQRSAIATAILNA